MRRWYFLETYITVRVVPIYQTSKTSNNFEHHLLDTFGHIYNITNQSSALVDLLFDMKSTRKVQKLDIGLYFEIYLLLSAVGMSSLVSSFF
jgi:hypothetical protein